MILVGPLPLKSSCSTLYIMIAKYIIYWVLICWGQTHHLAWCNFLLGGAVRSVKHVSKQQLFLFCGNLPLSLPQLSLGILGRWEFCIEITTVITIFFPSGASCAYSIANTPGHTTTDSTFRKRIASSRDSRVFSISYRNEWRCSRT